MSPSALETGLFAGTLYPLLERFEQERWVESEWEKVDPATVGRPAKHLYKLTPLGKKRARAALQEPQFATKTFLVKEGMTKNSGYEIRVYWRGQLVDRFSKPTMLEAVRDLENAGYARVRKHPRGR